MAKLIYVTNVSLDGYIEDAHGSFDWTEPNDEFFTFITDLVRPVGTYLYGRRLYETMAVWETEPALAAQSELMADFANVWQAADKIVYSTTLHAVSTADTRLERRFDPDAVRDMKTSAASDLTVGGSTPRRACVPRRAGRRVPALRSSGARRWRKARIPERRSRPVGAAGGAPVRQRCRVPPLPHPELTLQSHAHRSPLLRAIETGNGWLPVQRRAWRH